MKSRSKIFTLVTVFGLLTMLNAQAHPMQEESVQCEQHGWENHHRKMTQWHEKHLAHIKSVLNLNAEQQVAWEEYVQAIQWHAQEKQHHHDLDAMKALTAPERVEKWVAQSEERIAKHREQLHQLAAATKNFYAQLSPAQQKLFDVETMPRSHENDHHKKPE